MYSDILGSDLLPNLFEWSFLFCWGMGCQYILKEIDWNNENKHSLHNRHNDTNIQRLHHHGIETPSPQPTCEYLQ